MSERYCLRCGKVVLDPNVNYGINPDVVCECPPEQASSLPHMATFERQALSESLLNAIGGDLAALRGEIVKSYEGLSARLDERLGAIEKRLESITNDLEPLAIKGLIAQTKQEMLIKREKLRAAQPKHKRERKGKRLARRTGK